MNAGMKAMLSDNLKSLRLSTMLKDLENQLRHAKAGSVSYDEFLLNITEAEVQVRKENGRKRRIREAAFPLMKPLEILDYDAAPELDPRVIKELATGDFIKNHRNLILTGNSGTGKTHIATGLGMEACNLGIRTRFVTGCGIVNDLIEARDEKVLGRTLKRYAMYGLLIIDELGYVPFTKEGAELLFQVLAERHERKSVIITTNKEFGKWTEIFGEPSLTAALLDRVTHKAHVINFTWESYRLWETLKNKKTKKERK